jgi:hypothetical protein
MNLLKKLLVYLIIVNINFKIQLSCVTHKPIVSHGYLHLVATLKVLSDATRAYLKLFFRSFQPENFGKIDQNLILKFFVFLICVDPGVSFLENYLFLC